MAGERGDRKRSGDNVFGTREELEVGRMGGNESKRSGAKGPIKGAKGSDVGQVTGLK